AAISAAVDEQRLEIRLRAAQRGAILGRNAHVVAEVAQGHIAGPGGELQPALELSLLARRDGAALAVDARAPLERFQLTRLDDVGEARRVGRISRFAAHVRAVCRHRRKFFAELESLALLAAGAIAHALERAAAQGAAQLSRRLAAEQDGRGAFAQGSDTDFRARFAVDIAPLQGWERDVLA